MAPGLAERRKWRGAMCRLLLRIHRLRPLGGLALDTRRTLAPNPYKAIVLELYLAELSGRSIYQSALGGAAPSVSTHRQVARLEALGAVMREVDAGDNRRINVVLTPAMREMVERMLDAAAVEARRALSDCT